MPKKTLEQLGEARQDFYRKIGRGGPNVPAEVVIAVVGEVAAKKILEDGLNGDDLGFLANLLRSARVAGQPEWGGARKKSVRWWMGGLKIGYQKTQQG